MSIHRVDVSDAISAGGGPDASALDPVVAADGVEEWATILLPRLGRAGRFPDSLDGRSIHLHGTDTDPAEWYLAVDGGSVEATREHRKADVALRGPAQDLLLALWRRRPLDGLDIVGDVTVARALLGAAAV